MEPKRRAGRPEGQGASQLTEMVLDAATALFLENGYAATSLDAVITKAGIGRHTFYRRWPDKASLFSAVMTRGTPAFEAAADANDGRPVLDRLRSLTKLTLDRATTPNAVGFMRVAIAEGPRFPEFAEKFGEQRGSSALRIAERLIREAQDAGVLRAGDPAWFARALISLTTGLPMHSVLSGGADYTDPAKRREHLDRAWQLFLDGAKAETHSIE